MFRSLSFAVLVILVAGLAQRSNASILVANAALTAAGESPPTSPGIGLAHVTIDTSLHTLSVEFTFSGLAGNTTASHIHAPTSGPPRRITPSTACASSAPATRSPTATRADPLCFALISKTVAIHLKPNAPKVR